jgi:hypothetical protein
MPTSQPRLVLLGAVTITRGVSSAAERSVLRESSGAACYATGQKTVQSAPAGKFVLGSGFFLLEFRCNGKNEEGTFRIDDFLGLRYHRHLIMHPGRYCTSEELYFRAGGRSRTAQGSVVDSCEAVSTGNTFVSANLFEETMDEQAIKEYKERLREIDEEIAEEERAGFHEKAKELEQERDFIINHVAEKRRHGRKADLLHMSAERLASSSRNQNNVASKMTGAIRKARQDAERRIAIGEKGMIELSKHLVGQVQYKGGSWVYHPSVPPCDWLF